MTKLLLRYLHDEAQVPSSKVVKASKRKYKMLDDVLKAS